MPPRRSGPGYDEGALLNTALDRKMAGTSTSPVQGGAANPFGWAPPAQPPAAAPPPPAPPQPPIGVVASPNPAQQESPTPIGGQRIWDPTTPPPQQKPAPTWPPSPTPIGGHRIEDPTLPPPLSKPWPPLGGTYTPPTWEPPPQRIPIGGGRIEDRTLPAPLSKPFPPFNPVQQEPSPTPTGGQRIWDPTQTLPTGYDSGQWKLKPTLTLPSPAPIGGHRIEDPTLPREVPLSERRPPPVLPSPMGTAPPNPIPQEPLGGGVWDPEEETRGRKQEGPLLSHLGWQPRGVLSANRALRLQQILGGRR